MEEEPAVPAQVSDTQRHLQSKHVVFCDTASLRHVNTSSPLTLINKLTN